MTPIDMSRALVFGRTAETYARSRPTYPAEAVAWLVPSAAALRQSRLRARRARGVAV